MQYESRLNPREGGVTLILSLYVVLDPASILFTPKRYGIPGIPQKKLKFWQPKRISPFCTLTSRKDHKMHRNYPLKPVLFVITSKKYSQKLHIQKNINFSENHIFLKFKILNLIFKILNPQNWSEPTYI